MRRKTVIALFFFLLFSAAAVRQAISNQAAAKPRLGTGEIAGILDDGFDKAVTYSPGGKLTGITVKIGQQYQCYFFSSPTTTVTGGRLQKGLRVKVAYKNLVASEMDRNYFFTGDAVTITILDAGGRQTSSALSGSILFSSRRNGNQEIYALDLATRKEINLTNNAADDGYPRMSPDGRRVAFVSNRDGYWAIYLMNADGTKPVKLLKDQNESGYPAWASDSWLLNFAMTRTGERKNDIYVSGADGSTLRRLTNHPAEDVHPVRSPDGNKVAFASERDGNRRIYTMNYDGSGLVCLTNDRWYSDYPAWSPDGSRIAFASDRDSKDSNRLDIYVMNANGLNVQRLTNHSADDRHPCWSPDGKMLAFVSNRLGDRDIFTINADGSDPKVLVRAVGDDEHPQWNSTMAGMTGQITANADIRRIDFKNFTYQLPNIQETKLGQVRLRNGKYSRGQVGGDRLDVELYKLVYGDLTGDGNEEAVVILVFNFGGSAFWMDGQVFTLKEGRAVLLTKFDAGDRGRGGIHDLTVSNGLLVADYDIPGSEDASCCPSYYRIIKYKWNGRQLVEVEKTPIKKRLASSNQSGSQVSTPTVKKADSNASPPRKEGFKQQVGKAIKDGLGITEMELRRQLFQQLIADGQIHKQDCVEMGETNPMKLLSTEKVDLNGDGITEIKVFGEQGCAFQGARRGMQWLYRKTGNKYELLGSISAAEKIDLLNTSTNGYRDLSVTYPAGNNYPELREIFRFDGRRYQEPKQQRGTAAKGGGVGARPTGIANAKPEQGDWATFWPAFQSAVQKRDRKVLILLMANPFEAVSAGLYTPGQWIKELDQSGGWRGMEQSIKVGIKLNGSWKGKPSKISKNNYLIFVLGKDGKWRWAAIGGD